MAARSKGVSLVCAQPCSGLQCVADVSGDPLFRGTQFDLVVSAMADFAQTAILIDTNLNEIAVGALAGLHAV